MPVLSHLRIDILLTQATIKLKRLVDFDLYDKTGRFNPERSGHAIALESIFTEAQSLGYSRKEFYESIALEMEIYESDRRKRKPKRPAW